MNTSCNFEYIHGCSMTLILAHLYICVVCKNCNKVLLLLCQIVSKQFLQIHVTFSVIFRTMFVVKQNNFLYLN